MAYLIGIPASWFLPGLLRGIEGLSQPVLLAAVLVELLFLGVPFSGPPPWVRFPLLGTC